MSCPKTVHLLQEYFSDSLSVQAGVEFDKHLAQCGECRAELDTLLLTRQELLSWQEQQQLALHLRQSHSYQIVQDSHQHSPSHGTASPGYLLCIQGYWFMEDKSQTR